MAVNPATVSDITERWRPLTVQEGTVAFALLGDAWALLKHRVGTLEARLDAVPSTLDDDLVRMVVVRMVLRVLRNPDGVKQRSQTTGPHTDSWTMPSDEPGGLTVTDDDLDLLAAQTGAGSDAFTIRPALVPADWVWR